MLKNSIKDILLSKGYVYYEITPKDCPSPLFINQGKRIKQIGVMMASLASLGYALDAKALRLLQAVSDDVLNAVYREVYDYLFAKTGAGHKKDLVFYPQFPAVDNIPLEDKYFYAMIHYLTVAIKDFGCYINPYTYQATEEEMAKVRLPFNEKNKPTVIKLCVNPDQFFQILSDYACDSLTAPVAIPDVKKPGIIDVFTLCIDANKPLPVPSEIPFKENMAWFVGQCINLCGSVELFIVKCPVAPYVKTVTDVLRLYAVLSGSSPMVNDRTKFHSLPRMARRWLLKMLDGILGERSEAVEEFAQRRELWLRAFERLHPGEYQHEYAFAYTAARDLRDDSIITWMGSVDAAHKSGDPYRYLELLSQRPGVYARRLDYLLRDQSFNLYSLATRVGFPTLVLREWKKISDKVSIPVLFQLRDHFLCRLDGVKGPRAITFNVPSGKKTHVEQDTREPIGKAVIDTVIHQIDEAIGRQLATKSKKCAKVYIEGGRGSLSNYALPTNDRAVSDNVKDVPFGSYVELVDDTKTVIRLFTHWKNIDGGKYGQERVDIDLSAQFLNEDFSCGGMLSWHSLGGLGGDVAAFSGDVTNAPDGAWEFIDIRVPSIRKKFPKIRYVVMSNNAYTGQSFSDVPELFSGFMLRESLGERGDLYEPSTVAAKFDLKQESDRQSLAVVVDLWTLRVYKVDQPLPSGGAIAASSLTAIGALVRKAVSPRTSLMEALAIADGGNGKYIELVSHPKDADLIIGESENADIHPWDQEKISNLLQKGIDFSENQD